MKRWKLSLYGIPVAAALLAGVVLVAPAAAAQDKEEGQSTVKDLDTELAKQMEIIDEGIKKLRRTLRKAESNAESLEWIDKIEKAAVKSKDLTPAMAAKIPEAERAKWVENYKKDMDATIKTMDQLAAAVKAGKNDEAQKIYQTIKKQEDKGHEKYTEQ